MSDKDHSFNPARPRWTISPTRPIELLFDSSPMTFCSPEQLVETIVLTNPSEVRLPDLDDDDDDEDKPC